MTEWEEALEFVKANINVGSVVRNDKSFATSLLNYYDSRGYLSKAQWDCMVKLQAVWLTRLKQYASRTGRCIYCRRLLTDKDSVDRGYGPICAVKHNLPL